MKRRIDNSDGRLTDKNHWDTIYDKYDNREVVEDWKPTSYLSILIDKMLSEVIEKKKPKKILEMGCGNSIWLPYLANKYDLEVYGVDYSERGCELVRNKLEPKFRDNIFCMDFMNYKSLDLLPKVDMVFSLGVVEHFTNADEIITAFSRILSPGGVIFTEVPYLLSSTGKLCKLYQPGLYSKHVTHTPDSLLKAYEKANVSCEKCEIVGRFSLDMIAWGVEPRFAHFDSTIQSLLKRIFRFKNTEDGVFLYAYGRANNDVN